MCCSLIIILRQGNPGWPQTQDVAEDSLELLIVLLPSTSAGITGRCYHALFMGCWGSKTGTGACEASMLCSEPHVQLCPSTEQALLSIKFHSRRASKHKSYGNNGNDYVTLIKAASGAVSQFLGTVFPDTLFISQILLQSLSWVTHFIEHSDLVTWHPECQLHEDEVPHAI